MKKTFQIIVTIMFVVGMTQLAVANENSGKEHGGQEHGGSVLLAAEHGGGDHSEHENGGESDMKGSGMESAKGSMMGSAVGGMKEHHAQPSKDDIRGAMKSYVQAQAAKSGGYFEVQDVDTGKTRRLSLIRVHERVGKMGDYYYSCADFKDADSGEMLDLDLDVAVYYGELGVVDVRIHKLEGDARYTYDDHDNRIPLKDGTKSHLGTKGSSKGMPKGSMQGHSNEHGGH